MLWMWSNNNILIFKEIEYEKYAHKTSEAIWRIGPNRLVTRLLHSSNCPKAVVEAHRLLNCGSSCTIPFHPDLILNPLPPISPTCRLQPKTHGFFPRLLANVLMSNYTIKNRHTWRTLSGRPIILPMFKPKERTATPGTTLYSKMSCPFSSISEAVQTFFNCFGYIRLNSVSSW